MLNGAGPGGLYGPHTGFGTGPGAMHTGLGTGGLSGGAVGVGGYNGGFAGFGGSSHQHVSNWGAAAFPAPTPLAARPASGAVTRNRASSFSGPASAQAPTAVRPVQVDSGAGGLAVIPTRSMTIRTLNYNQQPRVVTSAVDADVSKEAQNIFNRIVQNESDTMSRLQLIRALIEDKTVCAFVLPGIDGRRLMEDEESYEAAHHLFNDIARGKQRVRFQEFLANFRSSMVKHSNAKELRVVFDRLDVNKDNKISRHELLQSVKREKAIFDFFFKESGIDDTDAEQVSNEVDAIYRAICGTSKHFDFADFVGYFRSIAKVDGCGLHVHIDRRQKRVLIIGPGFGAAMNPAQTQLVMQSGFQVHWCHQVPNPEDVDFMMLPHVSVIREAIDQVRPDILMGGSKGGAYAIALWQMGYWRGPTVLINAHPSCMELPADVPIVICHGDQDPIYPRPRAELENLITTGSPNMCFLYYSSTSGTLVSGHTPRVGDAHNMMTMCNFETLPRLMESVLCPEGPELHMMRTWLDRLNPQRAEAERSLGYTPQKLRQFWVSPHRASMNDVDDCLFDVPPASLEFRWVTNCFRFSARDPSTYGTVARARWERMQIIRIQRIENTMQEDTGYQPYFNSVKNSCESSGVEFVPGVHTRWLFHGSSAIDSIVSNPIQGFQPLASGSQGEAVWGRGTYFARDAEYVAAGPFCGMPAPDGTRRMLLCLVTTGMSCAGDPRHHGILPMRLKPHRYNSTVDSLSSPEVFIVTHPNAAYPAYVITFLC